MTLNDKLRKMRSDLEVIAKLLIDDNSSDAAILALNASLGVEKLLCNTGFGVGIADENCDESLFMRQVTE